jgi:hypothetical protein
LKYRKKAGVQNTFISFMFDKSVHYHIKNITCICSAEYKFDMLNMGQKEKTNDMLIYLKKNKIKFMSYL